jgi:mannose-6-phosphate isomerase-like protein (cupin superfamily)
MGRMDIWNVREMLARQDTGEHTYTDFFRSDELSLGLSIWPAGSVDTQQPHAEDEVYYVVAGRGQIQVGSDDEPVGPGSIIFVAAGVDHHFHDIEEALHVIVFWAPPHSR